MMWDDLVEALALLHDRLIGQVSRNHIQKTGETQSWL
jgi:hypothetical protein